MPEPLFLALQGHDPGSFIELGKPCQEPSRTARAFLAAGWRGAWQGPDGPPLASLLAGARPRVSWMSVAGPAATAALADWTDTDQRPLAVLVEAGQRLPFQVTERQPWRDALAANGYAFIAGDETYHYYVRSDQEALRTALAERLAEDAARRWQAHGAVLAAAYRATLQLRHELAVVQDAAAQARAEANSLREQLAAVFASTSWRMTAIVRWTMRLLHRQQTTVPAPAPPAQHAAPAAIPETGPAAPPAIAPDNIVGPPAETLLRRQLDVHMLPDQQ